MKPKEHGSKERNSAKQKIEGWGPKGEQMGKKKCRLPKKSQFATQTKPLDRPDLGVCENGGGRWGSLGSQLARIRVVGCLFNNQWTGKSGRTKTGTNQLPGRTPRKITPAIRGRGRVLGRRTRDLRGRKGPAHQNAKGLGEKQTTEAVFAGPRQAKNWVKNCPQEQLGG